MQVTTMGIDLAKNVFQVHGVDASGKVVVRKALRRSQLLPFFEDLAPCLIGMEACSSAHHWARELNALGHTVKLMPPSYVKPYVKRGKNDVADAEAICEAVTRPTMRFVPVKSTDQQAVLMLHRTRALLMRQRTMAVNALRGHLAEFGLVAAQGAKSLAELIESVFEGSGTDDDAVPPLARRALAPLVAQLRQLQAQIKAIEVELLAWHRATDASRRLETIPGVGFITATAIAATVTDPSHFTSGRPVRSLARARAATELERRQGTSRLDLEDGRPISAHPPRRRRNLGHAIRPEQERRGRPVGQCAAGATSRTPRLGCPR